MATDTTCKLKKCHFHLGRIGTSDKIISSKRRAKPAKACEITLSDQTIVFSLAVKAPAIRYLSLAVHNLYSILAQLHAFLLHQNHAVEADKVSRCYALDAEKDRGTRSETPFPGSCFKSLPTPKASPTSTTSLTL